VRVSTGEQGRNGYGLDTQRGAIGARKCSREPNLVGQRCEISRCLRVYAMEVGSQRMGCLFIEPSDQTLRGDLAQIPMK
jgi:hypothetical protein